MNIDLKNEKVMAILRNGKELFFKFGTKRVTIEEICQKSGVSKMTFYRNFKDKNHLTKIILNKIFEDAIDEYQKIMSENISFALKIKKIITLKIEKSNAYGDIFFNELIETNEELKNFIIQKSKEANELNMDFFKKGQKEGVIRKNMKPEFFMFLIDEITEVLNNEKLKKIIPDIHERFEELINYFFFGITNDRTQNKSILQENFK